MHFFLGRIAVRWFFLVVSWMLLACNLNAHPGHPGHPDENMEQPLMTPVPDYHDSIENTELPLELDYQDSIKSVVDRLHLNAYEAAIGDLSLCGGDMACLEHAKDIKSWICLVAVCNGTDISKKPFACLEEILKQESPIEFEDQINEWICPAVESPSTETRKVFMDHVPVAGEDSLVEGGAYLMALKGSAVSCENYIKDYVSPYGEPQWNHQWYQALSGCRILARESTREQEEKDLYQWFNVLQQEGDPCLDIVGGGGLRSACSTPRVQFSSSDER
jgi:hypothetical protein